MPAVVIDAPDLDVALALGPLAMLQGDPTIRVTTGMVERATFTPQGPGTLRVTWQPGAPTVTVEAFGDGSGWLLGRARQSIGAHDDPSDFQPSSGALRHLRQRFQGDRVPQTGTLWHDLAWTIVQQRIRRVDAARQWQLLVRAWGSPAPGGAGLFTPPAPERLAVAAPWALRRFGIDARRAVALRNAATRAKQLQRLIDEPDQRVLAKLTSVPGIGPWTASCLSAFTLGDPDTVIVGDSGIPSLIASTLAGERHADDARMLELLEPYRPHRYRVLRLAFAARTRRAS